MSESDKIKDILKAFEIANTKLLFDIKKREIEKKESEENENFLNDNL